MDRIAHQNQLLGLYSRRLRGICRSLSDGSRISIAPPATAPTPKNANVTSAIARTIFMALLLLITVRGIKGIVAVRASEIFKKSQKTGILRSNSVGSACMSNLQTIYSIDVMYIGWPEKWGQKGGGGGVGWFSGCFRLAWARGAPDSTKPSNNYCAPDGSYLLQKN